MHHLAQAARKVVALTGTIYGGKASSLFTCSSAWPRNVPGLY